MTKVLAVLGFIVAIAGIVFDGSGGDYAVANTMFLVGGAVGIVCTIMVWFDSRSDRRQFDQHLADYEAGVRDDLPQ